MNHNLIKNPNWQAENQLAIYKRSRRIWKQGTAVKQIYEVLVSGIQTRDLQPNSLAKLFDVQVMNPYAYVLLFLQVNWRKSSSG